MLWHVVVAAVIRMPVGVAARVDRAMLKMSMIVSTRVVHDSVVCSGKEHLLLALMLVHFVRPLVCKGRRDIGTCMRRVKDVGRWLIITVAQHGTSFQSGSTSLLTRHASPSLIVAPHRCGRSQFGTSGAQSHGMIHGGSVEGISVTVESKIIKDITVEQWHGIRPAE